jgi:hypothetical protein
MTLAPADRWDLGANVDVGTLMNRQTGAEIKRKAGGARIGYGFDTIQLSSKPRVPLRRNGTAGRDVDGQNDVAVPERRLGYDHRGVFINMVGTM